MAIAFMYSFIPINICSVPTVWKAVINICGLQLLSFFYVTSPHGFPGLALSRFETLIPKSVSLHSTFFFSPHRWNSGYRLESLCLFWSCDVHAILTSLVVITGKGSSEPWAARALPPFWYHTFQMRSAFMFLKQSQNESRIKKSLLKKKKKACVLDVFFHIL